MSLRLMKERMKISGVSSRDEMIRDGQNLLKEELEHDTSYSPTMYFYDADNEKDDRIANFRVYGRKNSSLNGNYMNFLTTYDNPVKIGDYIHDFVSYDIEDMRLDSVRNCVRYFKLEEEKGFENMCEIIEQYARDEVREVEIRKDAEIKEDKGEE